MKTLIFFTSQFPFGNGETFVENEFPFLANAFDRVFIVTNNINGEQTRPLSENVTIIRHPYSASTKYKIQALFNYFNPVVQHELSFIKNTLQLSADRNILSLLLGSYAHALKIYELILDLVAQYKIDVGSLYLYSYWMNNSAAGIALFKQKHAQVKAICRAHGWDVYFERHTPPYLPLRNFIIENIDACYCISGNGKQYLGNMLDTRAKNHLQLSRLGTFNNAGRKSVASGHGLSIVSCSNIIPLKRVHLIIDALALLKDIPIKWTHFGTGGLEDEIKSLASKVLSALPNVNYSFAGQISNKELLNYYANNPTDLFMNTSETEGLPVSIMEAFSLGIPAIAMDVGGISEIIDDGINGVLLGPESGQNEIAQAIIKFYGLPEEVKMSFRNNAFSTWDEKFNAQKNYKNFISGVLSL